MMIQPVIPSYDRGEYSALTQLVETYPKEFPEPLVVLDSALTPITAQHIEIINQLTTNIVHINIVKPTKEELLVSVIKTAIKSLEFGLLNDEAEFILYCEDDIRFSSKFYEVITSIKFPDDMGFLALYTPLGDHGNNKQHKLTEIIKINTDGFWGIQCVLLPRANAQAIVENENSVMKYGGYQDIKWSRFLGKDCRKTLYATYYSFAQHVSTCTILGNREHKSERFYDDII